MLERVRHLNQLHRHFGTGWLLYRVAYNLRLRAGVLRRRTPIAGWHERPLSSFLVDKALAEPAAYFKYRRHSAPHFFFDPADRSRYQPLFAIWDSQGDSPVATADDVAAGRLCYFEHTVASTGFPPEWHANPFTGQAAPSGRHWSEIADFDFGDIKVIWEPSRFGFAFALVRAYWRSGDEQYAEVFWRLVEDWREHNPPNRGPNWKCGQEISLRVMAWLFGLYGLLDSPATTAERVAMLGQMIAVSGERIAANFDYALSQRNNHGISEAAGLWTIGTLFPELHTAPHWAKRGRIALEAQGRALIYNDGAFSQHSVNYHRLMLHIYLWVLRLSDLVGQPFSTELRARVARAGEWLYQMQDEETGQAPYYGQNDGALVLPLSNSDYHDFRPVVGAACYLASGRRRYGNGPWDEDLLWLFGPETLAAPAQPAVRADLKADVGGYYTLRSSSGSAFIRCGRFRHRPGQADLLHADIWWRGQNVALDAGTYSYNAPTPWDNVLAGTTYHNTVTVDGLDQMERAGRFLWLPWARGQVRAQTRSARGHLAYWEGEHDGYRRLSSPASHRRAIVQLGGEHWLVLDAVRSLATHRYRLHWLAPDVPYLWDAVAGRLALYAPVGEYCIQAAAIPGGNYSLVRAAPESPRGWQAPYYGTRVPALSLALVVEAVEADFWTVLGPGACRAIRYADRVEVESAGWKATLTFAPASARLLLASITLAGDVEDTLELE